MQTIEFNHEWKMRLLNRFLTYVKIYSTSDAESETTPSSPQQWDIAKYIFQELQDLGLSDVSMDEMVTSWRMFLLIFLKMSQL